MMSSYYIHFGYLQDIDGVKIDKLVESDDSDKGIGIHNIFHEMGFEKLSNKSIDRSSRDQIIQTYYKLSDNIFTSSEDIEEEWVSDFRLNDLKGNPYRVINTEFIENFKKDVRGGREFFRSIKDSYVDNETHPRVEVVLINTTSFKKSLQLISKEALENEELTPDQIDFIKWSYWWGTKLTSRKRNLSSIKFEKR